MQGTQIALLNSVVEQMRARQPDGRLVLDLLPDAANLPNDIRLENNDSLYIPPQPVTVGVFGAVVSPASVEYKRGRTIGRYLRDAGGIQQLGDRSEIFVVRANGTVISGAGGLFGGSILGRAALPGDLIFVPVDASKGEFWARLRDITQILFTGAVTADVAEFAFGDTVNFAVKLDPRKIGFLPLIGPYNVERILIVRHAFTLDAREVASVTALPGQTEFNIPFKPTDRGRTDEFYAFVVTKLLPVGLFSLELGRATALAPDNLRQTVQIPAQLTGPTTFTVTAESRTVDGGFVPVPDARVEISNFSGGTTCGTLDRLNARTNASGVATFTVTPTASCLQLSFFVSTAVSPTVSTVVQHVTPAVVFPVFEGDLDLVFALALPLAAHLEEVTGNLRISSVPPGPESFANVSLPNLKRVGGRLDVGNAVSVQLPALESVGFNGLTVSSGTLGGLLTRFEAPALKQAFSITIRDNPALRTLAIGPVRVQTSFNIFRNGFPNFEGFSSGIVVGQNLQIFDNTGFSNQTAQDFVNRVTFLEGGLGGVGRNTGP